MSIYTVELDGKQYDIEGTRPPTEEEARQVVGEFSQQKVSNIKSAASNKPIPELRSGKYPSISVMQKLLGMSAEEQIANAQNVYAISQATGIPTHEVKEQNLTQNPQVTGMQRGPTSTELLQSQASLYGTAAMGAAAVTQPVALLKGLVGATIGYGVGKYAKPFERITDENAPQQIKELAKTGDELLSVLLSVGGYKASSAILGEVMPKLGLGNYAKNKAIAVRKGAMKVYQEMQTTYGEELKSLSTNPEQVDPTNAIGKMEEIINQRMPTSYSSAGKPIKTPATNKVDTALLKAYDVLYGKWANSKEGKVRVGDIVDSLRIIKDSGGETNKNLMRIAGQTQGEILGFIKDDINVPQFQAMQTKYRTGMLELEAIDKAFDIWQDNPIFTAKGEKFTRGGIFKSKEAENIAKLTTEKTGQTLKLGKVSSKVNQLMGNRILRYLLYGTIAGGAAGLGFKIGSGRD